MPEKSAKTKITRVKNVHITNLKVKGLRPNP